MPGPQPPRGTFRLAAVLLLASAAPACGDDDGGGGAAVEGTYDITANTLVTGGCEGTGASVPDSNVLVISRGEFFGLPVMQGFVCASEEGCGGEESFADWTFLEQRAGQWFSEASASSSGFEDDSCLLSYTESTLETVEGGVVLRGTTSTGEFELAGDACDPDAVDSRRDQLTCNQLRRLEATARE